MPYRFCVALPALDCILECTGECCGIGVFKNILSNDKVRFEKDSCGT